MVFARQHSITLLSIFFLSIVTHLYSNAIITPIEYKELDIPGLINCINRTHSPDGLKKLTELLSPSNNLSCIIKNQTIIQDLFSNKNLCQQLDFQLQQINTIDQSWWENHAKIRQDLHTFFPKKIYFPKLSWGKHAKLTLANKKLFDFPTLFFDVLFLARQYTLIQYLALVIGIEHASTDALIRYTLSTYNINVQEKRGMIPWLKSVGQGMTIPLRAVWPFNIKFNPNTIKIDPKDGHANLLETTFALMYYTGGSVKDIYDSLTLYLKSEWTGNRLAHCIALPTALIHSIFNIYGYFSKSKYFVEQTAFLHTTLATTKQQLCNFNVYLAHAHKIDNAIQKSNSPALKELCKPLHTCIHNGSASFKELVVLLQSKTFQRDSFFYRRGLIIRAFLLYCKIKKEVRIIRETIALLDAYLSCALLVSQHQELPISYCFATISDNITAIDCQHMWLPTLLKNPKLNSSTITTNSIMYGEKNSNKSLICGPNGSGKSMILKSLGVGIVLAQSVGLFPAKSATIPIFDHIRTCINPQENSSQGLSFFGSELLRLNEITHIAQTCAQENKKIIILFDEPCRGTHPQETARRFGEFCVTIAPEKTAFVFCTSHSNELLTIIQQQTDAFFMVQHMEILHLKPHDFFQTYLLKPGAHEWWFTDDGKRREYIDWFIEHIIKPQITTPA